VGRSKTSGGILRGRQFAGFVCLGFPLLALGACNTEPLSGFLSPDAALLPEVDSSISASQENVDQVNSSSGADSSALGGLSSTVNPVGSGIPSSQSSSVSTAMDSPMDGTAQDDGRPLIRAPT